MARIDVDRDGDTDRYVANGSDANYLYRNENNGRFRESGTWAGCALDEKGAAQASMGIVVGDVNGDGRRDRGGASRFGRIIGPTPVARDTSSKTAPDAAAYCVEKERAGASGVED